MSYTLLEPLCTTRKLRTDNVEPNAAACMTERSPDRELRRPPRAPMENALPALNTERTLIEEPQEL
jgi:hypothetical protein